MVPYRDQEGRIVGFTGYLKDISLQKSLEVRLEESLELYRTLVENSSDVIFQLLPDLTVLYVNPAIEAVLGYEASEWLHEPLDLPALLPPEEVRKLKRIPMRRFLRRGLDNRLLRVCRKDGTPLWGLVSMVPVSGGGAPHYIQGIMRDVTEDFEARKKLEAQHEQLKSTIRQLEEAGRLQEEFVSNITHELRTPLTTIMVTAELLERYAAQELPEKQAKQVRLVQKNSGILLERINELLDLVKLKRGGFTPREETLILSDFVRDLTEDMAPQFSSKGLEYRVSMEEALPDIILCDREMLRKALQNLLSNAAKFTDAGEAALEISQVGTMLCFTVSDTGIGIPKEEFDSIFEEFRQVDGSDSRRYPGTGLGLAIARRFVDLIGGSIEVRSEVGKGSEFRVLVPFSHGDE